MGGGGGMHGIRKGNKEMGMLDLLRQTKGIRDDKVNARECVHALEGFPARS